MRRYNNSFVVDIPATLVGSRIRRQFKSLNTAKRFAEEQNAELIYHSLRDAEKARRQIESARRRFTPQIYPGLYKHDFLSAMVASGLRNIREKVEQSYIRRGDKWCPRCANNASTTPVTRCASPLTFTFSEIGFPNDMPRTSWPIPMGTMATARMAPS